MYIVIVTLKDGTRYTRKADTYDDAIYLCFILKCDDDIQSVSWDVV